MSYRAKVFVLFSLLIGLKSGTPAFSLNHTVMPADTLYGLSIRYHVPVQWIARANGLENERIRAGDILGIPVDGIHELVVRPGETLSELSLVLDISQDELMAHNGLTTPELRIGQVLNVPPPVPAGTHRVRPGDSIIAVAAKYGIPVDRLRAYNDLDGDTIHPDQILTVVPPRPEGYRVENGDSLWSIARRYDITMAELRKWNALAEGEAIHPGDVLALFPGLGEIGVGTPGAGDPREIALAAVSTAPALTALPREYEYFYAAPRAPRQPDVSYWEGSTASSSVDFRRAKKVMDLFLAEIGSTVPLSSALKGWHIVIDPGHGGLDPGAIVSVKDGNGNQAVVTEDEYVYDIALRLYRFLTLHGASVSLTVIAPDHHIRNGVDARTTFVNRKSEVYAHKDHNDNPGWRPVGTAKGLDLRKTVAKINIRNTPYKERRNGTLFVSIHADNSPDLPAGTAVLFDGADDDEVERSKNFAAEVAPHLGLGSFIRRQSLRVLQNNPADAGVLVEARNIHYEHNAWALRSPELREQDARMIGEGILSWSRR